MSDVFRKVLEKLTETEKELAATKLQLHVDRCYMEDLQQETAALRAENEELKKTSPTAEMIEKLSGTQGELEHTKLTLHMNQGNMEELQEENAALSAENERLKKSSPTTEMMPGMENELEAAKLKVYVTECYMEDVQQEIAALRAENEKMKKSSPTTEMMPGMENELEAAKLKVYVTECYMEDVQQEIAALRAENEKMKKNTAEMMEKLSGIENELEALKLKNYVAECCMEDVQQINAALMSENEKLKQNSITSEMMSLLENLGKKMDLMTMDEKVRAVGLSRRLTSIETSCKVTENTVNLAVHDIIAIKDAVKEENANMKKIAKTISFSTKLS